jgi:sigma-B regulation protein RsbU (phosphoserine phosphatase)
VRPLAQTVSQIAEGDYSARTDIRTGDELEVLGKEINRMAQTLSKREEQIQSYVKQIEEWNKELEAKVAERTRDLEEKNIRLRMISEELGNAYGQLDNEMKIVGELQKRLLPATLYDREGISIRSFYLPNGRAGGDYYDFITPGKDKLFLLIGDVSGHGTPAAFIMGITRAIAHTLIDRDSSPGDVLSALGSILNRTVRSGEFVTMFLGCLNLKTQELIYTSAGHPAPLLLRKEEGYLEELKEAQGLPLGILEETPYEEAQTTVKAGDRLLLYTDGIIEAFNDERQAFGVNRLYSLLLKNSDASLEDLLETIMKDLESFVQRPLDLGPLEDDVTLVAIDFRQVTAPTVALPG